MFVKFRGENFLGSIGNSVNLANERRASGSRMRYLGVISYAGQFRILVEASRRYIYLVAIGRRRLRALCTGNEIAPHTGLTYSLSKALKF